MAEISPDPGGACHREIRRSVVVADGDVGAARALIVPPPENSVQTVACHPGNLNVTYQVSLPTSNE